MSPFTSPLPDEFQHDVRDSTVRIALRKAYRSTPGCLSGEWGGSSCRERDARWYSGSVVAKPQRAARTLIRRCHAIDPTNVNTPNTRHHHARRSSTRSASRNVAADRRAPDRQRTQAPGASLATAPASVTEECPPHARRQHSDTRPSHPRP